jgi:NAD(P)-dependent dehydrogenase (short-subunit alcohol dehydrogenase family)
VIVLSRLKDKVALIAGVSRLRGTGYAVAKSFVKEGATIAIVGKRDMIFDRVNELQSARNKVVGFKVDLTKSNEVNQMVTKILDQFGKIDILCNVVGMGPFPWNTFLEMTEKEWDTIIDINLKTVFNCCKSVVPYMVKQKYGRIVNFSSVTGPMVTLPHTTHYSAAKGAVSAFTRALALELGKYGITVNAICPGTIDTRDRPDTKVAKEMRDQISKQIPLGRVGEPEEVADLALFLASDESKYITGTEIVIDGGHIISERKIV